MRLRSRTLVLAAASVAALAGPVTAAEKTDAELIANAISAAPAEVGKNATVGVYDAEMKMRVLRQGTNGFTCLPDLETSPTNDPVCFDAAGLAWNDAVMAQKPPEEGAIGFGYMLMGESAPNNTDPYATAPAEGEDWMVDGPHVMILNAPTIMASYPQAEHPDHSQPFVMWPNTPYAHLMVPVR